MSESEKEYLFVLKIECEREIDCPTFGGVPHSQ